MSISLILILIFISAIYIQILKDFRTVTLRTDTTDTPTHRDASHLKILLRKSEVAVCLFDIPDYLYLSIGNASRVDGDI